MAKISIAFVAALVGVFVMQSALQGDRRLVVAGFRAGEAVLPASKPCNCDPPDRPVALDACAW